jgi:hypothetical protein
MGPPQHDEQVASLAAQVGDLRADLRTVKARVESGQIPVHGLSALRDRLAALEALAGALEEDTVARTPAPFWIDLHPDDYAAQMGDLSHWVDKVLAVNYPHAAPLPCWAAHPAAVWELSTLAAEWARIYARKRPPLADALTWHERHLPGVTERLVVILKECTKAGCDLTR